MLLFTYWVLDHAEFMHQVPDDYLSEMMPIAKKIAAAGGYSQYNVLQVCKKLFMSMQPCSKSDVIE